MNKSKTFYEILEKIKLDEETLNKFLKTDDVNEIYEICKEYGYSGTFEEIQNEILNKLKDNSSLLDENELSNIAGGKMSFKKELAAVMSTLTLMGTVMPSSSAVDVNKRVSNKTTVTRNSPTEPSTLEKIKYWGSKGMEKVKDTTSNVMNKAKDTAIKASENKKLMAAAKYGGMTLGGAVIIGGTALGIHHSLRKNEGLSTYTEEGRQVFEALSLFANYVLRNFDKFYDANGSLIKRDEQADQLSITFLNSWNNFAKKYYLHLIYNPEVPQDLTLIPFLTSKLPSITGSNPQDQDAKAILDLLLYFSTELNRLKEQKPERERKRQEKELLEDLQQRLADKLSSSNKTMKQLLEDLQLELGENFPEQLQERLQKLLEQQQDSLLSNATRFETITDLNLSNIEDLRNLFILISGAYLKPNSIKTIESNLREAKSFNDFLNIETSELKGKGGRVTPQKLNLLKFEECVKLVKEYIKNNLINEA